LYLQALKLKKKHSTDTKLNPYWVKKRKELSDVRTSAKEMSMLLFGPALFLLF